ncbi:hypothetical protein BE21_18485 [Sorangium cellulosum]|uniref:Uncharacterized protein n=1 Tax=Sorangium cellulosum TaxID=56 RepID=A0A150TX94_SORCE|nr:hypothetical protein BE21_18485 [Sorangium cellulosum]
MSAGATTRERSGVVALRRTIGAAESAAARRKELSVERSFVMVFDDTLSDMYGAGAGPPGAGFIRKYTSLEHTDIFSSAGQLCLQAVMQRIGGLSELPLRITMEHSANGYDWKPKHTAAVL